MSVIVHIGSPKTGTTSIQNTLSQNEAALSQLGFRYARAFRKGPSHNFMTVLLRQGEGAFVARKLDREARLSDTAQIILSSELLFALDGGALLEQALSPNLKDDLRIICYLRRPDLYAEAMFKQRLKSGKLRVPFRKFLRTRMETLRYLPILEQFSQRFGQTALVPRIFSSTTLSGGDVVEDFLDLVGVRDRSDLAKEHGQSNKTLSLEASQAVGEITFSSSKERRDTIRHLMLTADAALFRSRDILDPTARSELLNSVSEDLEQIRHMYFPDREQLFSTHDLEQNSDAPWPSPQQRRESLELARQVVAEAHQTISAQAEG